MTSTAAENVLEQLEHLEQPHEQTVRSNTFVPTCNSSWNSVGTTQSVDSKALFQLFQLFQPKNKRGGEKMHTQNGLRRGGLKARKRAENALYASCGEKEK
jgi:hypothetical protein